MNRTIRELVEDRLQRDVVELDVGAIPHGGSGELERERVPACEPVYPAGVGGVEAGSRQELAGLPIFEVAEPDTAHELAPTRRRIPACDGRLAPRHDQPRVVAQGRCKRQADPAVEQAKNLICVEDQHDALPKPG